MLYETAVAAIEIEGALQGECTGCAFPDIPVGNYERFGDLASVREEAYMPSAMRILCLCDCGSRLEQWTKF